MNVSFNITCNNHNHNHNSEGNSGLPCEAQFESQVPEGEAARFWTHQCPWTAKGFENVRNCKALVVSLAQGEVKPLMRQVYWLGDSRYLAGGGKLHVEGGSFVLCQNRPRKDYGARAITQTRNLPSVIILN